MITKQQYFGMYLGKDVSIPLHYTSRPTAVLTGIKRSNEYVYESDYVCTIINEGACNSSIPLSDCKLILRPYEDMTNKETEKFIELQLDDNASYGSSKGIEWKSVAYLISIGIDVFNLKAKGFAVYESDLKGE